MTDSGNIESILQEDRVFDPPANFNDRIGGAHISSMDEYATLYQRSMEDPDGFWSDVADELDWFQRWDSV